MDSLSILQTHNIPAAKEWLADGTIKEYGHAKYFKQRAVKVTNIFELSNELSKLEGKPTQCVVQGSFNATAPAIEDEKEGHWLRRGHRFNEVLRHYVMMDVENWTPPAEYDAVNDPVPAIELWIKTFLPVCFHDVTYRWHLSNSAGHPSKGRELRAHLFFWLAPAYNVSQLSIWAEVNKIPVDSSVFNPVQVFYTANPILGKGVVDPVRVRSGLEESPLDLHEVNLVIDEVTLARAKVFESELDGLDLADPKEKLGAIGAFCRTYTMEQILDEFLPDEFEWVTERRLTWNGGNGTREGAFVTPCREYLVNKHGTDPLKGRASNKWDLVRVHKFGHLDASLTDDEIAITPMGSLPSMRAMMNLVSENEEVEVTAVAVSLAELDEVLVKVREAADVITIKTVIAPMLRKAGLDALDHEQAVSAVAVRLRELTGVRPQIKDVRDMCAPVAIEGPDDAPAWASEYVWLTSEDKFLHIKTQEMLSKMSFNARHNRDVQVAFGEDSLASDIALDVFMVDVVHRRMYLPYGADRFSIDGVSYANSYRSSTVPQAASARNASVEAAFEAHILAMCDGDYKSAKTLIQWLAHQVQFPGKKVRWSPLIKGIEGDGKTLLGGALQASMGLSNVSTVSPKVLKTDFNGWAEGRCVNVLEELRMAGHNRHDIANAIKPNIANDHIPIHRKGMDEYNVINVTNYIAFTNFTDALPLDDTDRRWFIIFSPYKKPSDLPDADYFKRLYDMVNSNGAEIRAWFLSIDMTGFNANGRAPDSKHKAEMIAESITDVEWAAMDLIEEGALGVTKNVISSGHFSEALEQKTGEKPRTSSVNHLLRKLGFDPYTTSNDTQVKWFGRACRIWSRDLDLSGVDAKVLVRDALDASK